MTKLYEMAFILDADIKEEDVAGSAQKIKEFISELAGNITKEQTIQKKRLAYPVKKAKQGYFGFMLFELEPANLKTLDKKLKLEESLLRYMIIAVDKDYMSQMKRQEEEVKEKFRRITQPEEAGAKKTVKMEDKSKLEEIEKKLEEILDRS